MSTVNLGNLKFTWKGDWQASTLYNKDDIVKYGPSVFVCIDSHVSSTTFATNSAKFEVMSEGLENAGSWSEFVLYKKGQTVTYGGAVYIALVENQADNPYTNTLSWQKFVDGQQFEGDWNAVSSYQKGDIVKYGGYLYVAKQNVNATTPISTTFWDVYVKGQERLGDWTNNTQYKPGEIVKYGGNRYIVKEGQTPLGNLPSDSTYYDTHSEGIAWKGDWVEGSEYAPNDLVKRGGNIYLCTSETNSNSPEVNNNFVVYAEGFNWRGEYSASNGYSIGDVVRVSGRTYICVESYDNDGSTLSEPPNTDYWELYTDGMAWKGSWDVGTEYEINDVVEYAQSSYISLIADNVGTVPGSDAAVWNMLAQGDSNAVLTTQGDIIIRDATQTTRLGIGPAGSFLYSDGNEPKWGHITPQNDYYVSPQGDDTNDGRTTTSSWRTIKHACEQTFSLGQVRINVSAGVYEEQCPIRVGRSVVLEGNGLGAVTISPNISEDKGFGVGISDDGSTPNANSYLFLMNNGARMRNFVFRNFSTGSVLVSLDPGTGPDDTSVWITSQSPYVQNCTSFTPGGTGFKIDGGLHNGGYKSMVANDWTQINSDGIGIHALNDGRTEIVSCFTYYCNIGYLAESGAKIRAIVGNNSYGEYGAVARGFSQLETPLTGKLRLDDKTIDSVIQLASDVHVFTSYRDEVGNRFFVGHTNPTGTDVTSTFDNTASYPFVAKFNSAGSLDWIYTYESSYGSIHSAVELSDRIYCSGCIYDGTNKGFILSISKAGEIQWQKTIGDTGEIYDLTTDGNNLFGVGEHITDGGVAFSLNPAGVERWSTTLEYTTGTNTLIPVSCCFAGNPTTSVDTYALAGDATAENQLYVASYDTTANQAVITRLSSLGAYETSYQYGDIRFSKLRIDTGNGDGIYLAAAGYYDNGSVSKLPFIARIAVNGDVQWQYALEYNSEEGEFKDILPFGNDIFVSGYLNSNTNTINNGLVARFTSSGNESWSRLITNGSNNVSFNGVMLDGVNVIAAGIDSGDSVISNVQRDLNNDIGTVTTGSYSLDSIGIYSYNNSTVITKAVNEIDNSSTTLGSTDTSLSLNQSPTQTRTVVATRSGFAGIGTGVLFSVDGLARRPKEGSVLQIDGDSETYFVIGVDNFIENFGVLNDNNPNAVAALTNNKSWIQDETIGWITDQVANATPGSIWDSFTYDAVKCERDVGLIVDALITDLDSSIIGSIEQNDETVYAAKQYWSGSTSLVAGQESQTAAAITYMKGLVGNAMDKSAPAATYSANVQDTSHSAVEAGTQALAEDLVDIVVLVIENGEDSAPVVIGTGTAQIQLDPAIPSNKTPNDDTNIVFREAFSQVRMSGHDFLDIGTGGFADTNYPVIIAEDYSQQPNQDRETLAEGGGRVFYVTTDQDGNFRVGDYFKVEQSTGRATLSSEEFDLAGLNELQLGSITAGKQGATINEFSTDGTFADNSDTSVPTEKATKTYVDQEITKLSESAGKITAGSAPTQSKVEVTGTGAASDTVDFDIEGSTISQIGQQYILIPKGTTNDRPVSPVNGYIRYNTDIEAFEGYANSQWSGIGGGNPWVIKTNADSPFTAANNDRLFIDTSSGPVTVELPASPSTGDSVRFKDLNGTFQTNNLTVNNNGSNINGITDVLTVAQEDAGFELVYTDATNGWKLLEV